jgi:signal transduction histidine kinase/CheY-like chemotaxis protein
MRRFFSGLLWWVALLAGAALAARAQPPATPLLPGLPLITNYTPTVYRAHEQVWDILEGPDGRFYFANGDGLLVYDNNDWELVSLPNKSHVRSLGLSADSTVYLGGDGELGYVRTDAGGRPRYVSLVPRLPASERVFGRVWTTALIGGKMHFQTSERLFVWDGQSFRVHSTGGKLPRTFLLHGTLYGALPGTGLVYWTGRAFEPAPRGDYFADKTVRVILPFGPEDLLVGTKSGELFRYNPQRLVPFRTGIEAQLAQYGLERGCWLDNERLVLSPGSSGLYVLDRAGQVLQVLNDAGGLVSNGIIGCYVDRKGNLWAGTHAGISKVAFGEPLRVMDRRTGLHGLAEFVVTHAGKLFVGTKEGLFVAGRDQRTPSFRRVDSVRQQIWALLPLDSSLLVSQNDGAFEWRAGRVTRLNAYPMPAAFVPSAGYPGLLWMSMDDGLAALQRRGDGWREVGKKRGLTGSVRALVEYRKGEVWLGTRARGAYRLRFGEGPDGAPDPASARVRQFGPREGLPPGDAYLLLVDNRLHVFVPQAGQVFVYREAEEKFVPDPFFGPRLSAPGNRVAGWYAQPDGTLWFRTGRAATGQNTLIGFKRQPGGYHTQSYRVPANVASFDHCLYVTDGMAFFGGQEGVLVQALQPGTGSGPARTVPLLTGVHLQQKPVAFRGGATRLPFGRNAALRVHFAAPFFSATDQIRYQTRLVGFANGWSAWTRANFKEYTNLWEGDYEFQVRGMDVYGRVSPVTRWAFTVTPPWYRQGWMYAVYLLGLASAGYGVVRWRWLRLEADNRRLENLVAERTAQLARQHDQLRDQSEKLREMDRLKSQFFANISHEFRTPLTLIIGLIRKGQPDLPPGRLADHRVILHNAHRLLRLINQLLELSKLEAGSTRLRARQADLMPFLRQIAAAFASLADQKHISFSFNGSPLDSQLVPVHLYFDPEKLEQVLTNLLSNAFKFTPEGGAVDLSVAVADHDATVRVSNTGPGIPAGALPYVFDRFYQVEGAGSHEGTGIGLALVKELVALHGGSVEVRSAAGGPTVFTVRLPLGSSHLFPGQLADPAEEPVPAVEGPGETYAVRPAPAGPAAQPGGPLVLVVEDHPDLRAYISGQLSPDYQVLEAEEGEKGWQLAEEHLPDLVVSDVMMPGLNGMQLLERLKNSDKTSHIPVILLTARAGRENRLDGLSTGADDYLTKPFDAEELRVRVRNLIRSRQQLREKFATWALLEPDKVQLPSQGQAFLEKLHRVLEEHLDDEAFGVEGLGDALGMSRSQMHRKLKAITNQSPGDLIRSYRLQRAADLIRQDAGNLSEIAWQTGFSSLSHFSRSFHEEYGCSPSEFKKKNASPAASP